MRKKIILLVLSVIVVVFVLSTSTYALFYKKNKLDNTESYATGNLQIVLQNDEEGLGNKLTLNNALPMSDSDGKNSTPYRFKVSNIGNLDYTFDLNLTKSGTINGNYIKVMVDDNEIVTLSSNTIKIASDLSLLAGESKIVEIRIWLDENTPNSEIGKTLSATLNGTGKGQVFMKASDKIIKLAGSCTSHESGFEGICATNPYEVNGETKYHEYRYIGGEVNNYVKFNDDLYRIIGAFDKNSYDIESVENNDYGDYLIKLISARELTAAAWGAYNAASEYTTYSNYKNNWDGLDSDGNTTNGTGVPASANILLNEYFLNPTKTSTYGECINWTYGSNNNTYKSKNCSNIKGYGIQTEALRNYIQSVTWYLYGYTGNGLSKANFYQCERNNYSGCTSANSGAYSGTTTASIGLMYVSDYMYASGYIASNNTSTTGSSSNFMNLNWLYNGYEWTITPRGNSDADAFIVNGTGIISHNVTYRGLGLRPTFYLKSTIKIKSGDGTFASPYIIG